MFFFYSFAMRPIDRLLLFCSSLYLLTSWVCPDPVVSTPAFAVGYSPLIPGAPRIAVSNQKPGERQETGSPSEPPEGDQPCTHLDFKCFYDPLKMARGGFRIQTEVGLSERQDLSWSL